MLEETIDALIAVRGRCRARPSSAAGRLLGDAGLPAGTYDHFQAFKRAPQHRAYAFARNVNGSYSAVFVGNEPSPDAAEQAAMARCRSYASQHLYADPSSCRVYAVDDTILSTGQKIAPAGG